MADIQDASGQKLGSIGEDNKVRNLEGAVIGSVSSDGQVYSIGQEIGHVDGRGYVYEGATHVGTVHPDGRVFDAENHPVGKIVGDHIESGGAALLLLVR